MSVRYRIGAGDGEQLRAVGEALFGGALRAQVTRPLAGSELVEAIVVLGLDEEGIMYVAAAVEGAALSAELVEAIEAELGVSVEEEGGKGREGEGEPIAAARASQSVEGANGTAGSPTGGATSASSGARKRKTRSRG